MSYPAVQPNPRVNDAISEQQETARKELGALLDGHFAELAARVQEECEAAARHASIEEVHRAVRRFEQCEDRQQWAATLLDSVAGFCSRGALWMVSARSLRFLPGGPEIPLEDAPALAEAVDSRDTVVTLATPSQLSDTIATLFDAVSCAVLPVIVRERAAAVLVAVGEHMDVNGLEAMASLAGAALDRLAHNTQPLPAGEALSEEEQGLHLRAQRFARVRVAEIRLYSSEAVRRGRDEKRVYAELKDEIDESRAAYKHEFLPAPPSLPDYLHLELIRTLAHEDVSVLGEDYPGPLL